MNKLLLLILLLPVVGMAQTSRNANPDGIVGMYRVDHAGQHSKVKVFKTKNGTYSAMCVYLKDSINPKTGKLYLDIKNPDKSLRNTPCNRIIIFQGMKYNDKKQRWEGGKIYDPTRGIRANCACQFETDSKLSIRGSIMGIGETVTWCLLD